MRLMRLAPVLAGALLFISALNARAVSTCERLFDPHVRLNTAQISALRGLEGGEYQTSIQRLTIDGTERLVVVVGERHVKSNEDAKRFEKIIDAFKFHGLEGIDTSKYWFQGSLKTILNHEKTAERPQGSSIDATERANAEKMFESAFVDLLATDIATKKIDKTKAFAELDSGLFLKEMAERVGQSPMDADSIAVAQDVILKMNGTTLKSLIEAKLPTISPSATTEEVLKNLSEEKPTHFSLEQDYKPSVRENLAVLNWTLIPALTSKRVCYAAACAVASTAYAVTKDIRFLETGMVGYIVPPVGAALLHVIGRDFFALDRRNSHMMKTLNKVLEKDPEIETIVVTVGMLHVPGIVGILKAQGSETVELKPH